MNADVALISGVADLIAWAFIVLTLCAGVAAGFTVAAAWFGKVVDF